MIPNAAWDDFTIEGHGGHPAAIAALSVFFYFDRPVHAIAAQVADGIERYVKFVGIGSLKSYSANSGYWKPLSQRRVNKDLSHLRDFPADHRGAHIDYDAGEGGVPGTHGLALLATTLEDSFERKRNNLLRLDFPATWVDTHSFESFVDFVGTELETMCPQSANAGFAFKRTEGSMNAATRGVNRKLLRYLGFDPCYSDVRNSMRDRTFTAHWLNFLDNALATKLGGRDAITAALRGCEVRDLSCGVLVRAAKAPPVADSNRGAPDIGCLPDVARVLAPTRVEIKAFGEPNFDAMEWLSRLDDMPARPWNNTDAA